MVPWFLFIVVKLSRRAVASDVEVGDRDLLVVRAQFGTLAVDIRHETSLRHGINVQFDA